jgi:hypothetical protein
MPVPSCLRCEGELLVSQSDHGKDIEFFECPSCKRNYARHPDGALTYRWLHPVSLPLYAVLFERDPVTHARDVAGHFVRQHAAQEVTELVNEIELELNQPTQQIHKILDNPQSEEVCREFLRTFVACIRLEKQ